ncbi:MAG: peptidylprolyl isomerase [Bacilli bacterium]
MKKKILIVLTICLMMCGCGNKKNPVVTMEIKDYGTVVMELYPKIAPNTVANFVSLIEDGFYDNNNFHRLVPGFVLQGGDPKGNGTGGPGYAIKGEFVNNNYFNNTLSHSTGVVSMARSQNNDSAGSQFFIVLDDKAKASLDNSYAGFGKVIEGLDIIKKIEDAALVDDNETGKLKENIVITKVTVDTFGETYKVNKISE